LTLLQEGCRGGAPRNRFPSLNLQEKPMSPATYACPDCKVLLDHFSCPGCSVEFPCVDGIPRFFSRDPKFRDTVDLAAAYDAIYKSRTGVWENQGRTPEFLRYFSSLLERHAGQRLLEIGCGEGFLLASVNRGEKFAVDLSLEALRRARAKGPAHFSLALGERLPFPDGHFDLITSVGVMEHFVDIGETLREILRILKPGGHYISLTHVELSLPEKIRAKIAEYFFPRPRPVRFARWLLSKLGPPLVSQPIQNRYTTEGARSSLAQSGFRVLDVLHRRNHPELPLIGPYVVIYVAQK
jgi:SAM-dependent methyltransferase